MKRPLATVRVAAASLASLTILSASAASAQDLDLRPKWQPEWSRFDLPHALITGSAAATALSMRFVKGPAAGWKQDVLFDAAFRDLFRAGDPGTRAALSDVSDALQIGAILYPFVIDAGLVASLVHDDPRLGLELTLIGIESFLVSSVMVSTTKSFVGRVRPDGEVCPATGDWSCRSDATRESFISGHTAAAFTSAGFVCANHVYLDLYGGGTADALACAGAVGLASATGVLRIAAGKHYATDVAAGAVLGFAAGYLVPTLLHYSSWAPFSSDFGLVPGAAPEGAGVSLTGWF